MNKPYPQFTDIQVSTINQLENHYSFSQILTLNELSRNLGILLFSLSQRIRSKDRMVQMFSLNELEQIFRNS